MTFLNETDTDYWRYIGKKMTYTRSWNYCICLHFFFTSVYGSNGVVRFIQRNIKLKSPILMTYYFSFAIFNISRAKPEVLVRVYWALNIDCVGYCYWWRVLCGPTGGRDDGVESRIAQKNLTPGPQKLCCVNCCNRRDPSILTDCWILGEMDKLIVQHVLTD